MTKCLFSPRRAGATAMVAAVVATLAASPAVANAGTVAAPTPKSLVGEIVSTVAKLASTASSSAVATASSTATSAVSSTGSIVSATVHAASSAVAAVDAADPTIGSTADCSTPALSQPFAIYGDFDEYAPVPGQASDDFAGTGWTLAGGATVSTSILADAMFGPVLALPSGSVAVSPPMCVRSDYPTARMMVDDAAGAGPVYVLATYAGVDAPVYAGAASSAGPIWTPSAVLQTNPGSQPGWQLVRFILVAGSTDARTDVYDLYVDPRMTS